MDGKADRVKKARKQAGSEQEGGNQQTSQSVPEQEKAVADANGITVESMLELSREQGEDDLAYGDRLNKEVEALVVEENESVYKTGKRLFVIMNEGLYQEETFNKYLASGKTTAWGRSKAYEVIAQVQDFILGKVVKVSQDRLDRVGWRKIQEIHGAVRDGIVGVDDALGCAGALSVQDLIKEKLDWILADARKRGLSPTVLKACQTCTFLRTFDPVQYTTKLGIFLADIDVRTDETAGVKKVTYEIHGVPIKLGETECSYCAKRNIGLSLGKQLSRPQGVAYAETCGFYEEAI